MSGFTPAQRLAVADAEHAAAVRANQPTDRQPERAAVSLGLPVDCASAGRRHDPVSLGLPGWVGCARCGASWDEQDDEARGKPARCEP